MNQIRIQNEQRGSYSSQIPKKYIFILYKQIRTNKITQWYTLPPLYKYKTVVMTDFRDFLNIERDV